MNHKLLTLKTNQDIVFFNCQQYMSCSVVFGLDYTNKDILNCQQTKSGDYFQLNVIICYRSNSYDVKNVVKENKIIRNSPNLRFEFDFRNYDPHRDKFV